MIMKAFSKKVQLNYNFFELLTEKRTVKYILCRKVKEVKIHSRRACRYFFYNWRYLQYLKLIVTEFNSLVYLLFFL